MFHIIQDAYCITRNKCGIYKQGKLYRYNGGLYVATGGGYARLLRNGDVGTPNLSYVDIFLPPEYQQTVDATGRLCVVWHGPVAQPSTSQQ